MSAVCPGPIAQTKGSTFLQLSPCSAVPSRSSILPVASIRKRLHQYRTIPCLPVLGAALPPRPVIGFPSRVQIELANLVEQRLVADAQHARRILAAPVRFLQRVRDRFHLRFILQSAHQSLKPCSRARAPALRGAKCAAARRPFRRSSRKLPSSSSRIT